MLNILVLVAILGLLIVIVNMAEVERVRRTGAGTGWLILGYGSVVLIQFVLFLFGIGFQMVGRLQMGGTLPELDTLAAEAGVDLAAFNWTLIGAGLWIPALIGMIVLLPQARRLLARVLPIEPANHVHAVALSLATLAVPNLTVTLGIGLSNLTAALDGSMNIADLVGTLWAQNLGFVLLSLLGVGWLTRRDLRAAVSRLKLTVPTLREVGIGAAIGVGLLVLLSVLLAAADALGLSSPEVDALSEELYGPIMRSLPGLLTIAVAAPLGEETLFRGALQPRFGRLLTAVLFTIVHGNYGLSVVSLGLFLVGYTLGFVRDRYNTTTSMVVHATFNGIQALIAFFAFQYGLGV